jgi:hypothetical protein
MLINKIRATYREITGYIEPAAPVTIIPGQRAAANTGSIGESEMLARSRRRRRAGGAGLSNHVGWTVRTW